MQQSSAFMKVELSSSLRKRNGPALIVTSTRSISRTRESLTAASASLGNARQFVHLTGKANFPCSRLAGGPAPQDRRKRFNRRFPERRGKAAGCPQFSGLVTKSTAPALCKSRSNSPASPLLSTSGVRRGLAGMLPRAGTRGSCRAVLSMAEYAEVSRTLFP